jgi:hypothetical protein
MISLFSHAPSVIPRYYTSPYHPFEDEEQTSTTVMDADDSRIYSPEEKCIYYHNNHTRIFTSVYEGIPENLLLNFMGWLVSIIF